MKYIEGEKMKERYWLVSSGGREKRFLAHNFVGIDYGIVDNLSEKSEKELMSLENGAQFKRLINDIKKGDKIILKRGTTKIFAIGIVESDYYFDNSLENFKHLRRVNWIKKGDWNFNGILPRNGTIFEASKKVIEFAKKIEEGTENMMNYGEYVEILKSSHNIIFHGAPGTGKTYLAKQVAAQMIGCSTDELYNSEQFDFVQFHPNYDYSDFVEGLRPVNHNGIVGFERRNGIFMNFCERAKSGVQVGGQDNFDEAWDKFIDSVLDSDDYYIVKTLNGKKMHLQAFERNGITGVTEKDSTSRYYNHDQCYNVYRGLSGVPKGGFDNYRKAIIKHLKEEFSLKDYKEPQEGSNKKPYVFVIDEINRGDISKILGELFFSIDPNYRGIKGAVTTQFSNLYDATDGKNPGDKFYIPENVYVIGTMNDVDRSVDSFDFAMRRRFRFIEVKAEQRLSMLEELDEEKREEAEFRLLNLNRSISATEGLSESYHVGPSYFLKLKDLDYNYDALWSDYIKPLLIEYLRGSYDFQEILDNLKDAYNTIDETGDLNESDGQ